MFEDVEIRLEYSTDPFDPPGFWAGVWSFITAIATAVAQAFTTALTTGAKEIAAMFALERIIGIGVSYAKQQASTWLTKALADAGQMEWLSNLLHAVGLDFADLMQVGKNALDAGFGTLTTSLMNTLKETGVLSAAQVGRFEVFVSSHGNLLATALQSGSLATRLALSDHASLMSRSTADWTMFTTRSYEGEEMKMRQQISAIFTDTPERIQARSELETATGYAATQDAIMGSLEQELPGVVKGLGKIVKPLQDFLNEHLLTVRNSIFYLLVPRLPVSYEHVGSAAISAFAFAVGLGFAAHGVAVAADLVHPLKHTGLPQLAAFLADMAGFAAIARDTWYEDLNNFLGTPYKHYSLRYFRPSLPSEGNLDELYSRNHILAADYVRAMEYQGYRDEWISAMAKKAYRHPRVSDLSLMLQDPTMTTSDIYVELRHAGYSPHTSTVMTRQLVRKMVSLYLTAYRTQVMRLFEKGYMSEELFDSQLEPLRLSSEGLFLMKKTARFAFIEDHTDLSLSMFKDMYDKDLIDDSDFEASLAGLGIVKEKRDVVVSAARVKKTARIAADEKAEIKKKIREQQTLLVDTYVLAYRAGTMDEGGLLAALQYSGLSSDLAVLTVGLERQKRILMETRKKVSTKDILARATVSRLQAGYISLFEKDLIDDTTLERYLLSLELDPEDVQDIIALEILKKTKPPAVMIKPS